MTDLPTFSSDDYEPPPAKPFRLTGRTLTARDPWTVDFSVLGAAPQGALADLAAAVTIENGEVRYGTSAVLRFLRAVLVPGDLAGFDALVRDKERVVPLEQLGDVMMWAAGLATGRPTGPLPTSTDGQRSTEAGSEDDASSLATVPAG